MSRYSCLTGVATGCAMLYFDKGGRFGIEIFAMLGGNDILFKAICTLDHWLVYSKGTMSFINGDYICDEDNF